MKNIFLLLLLVCLLGSCKRKFLYKLSDFKGQYRVSLTDANESHLLPMPKCTDGWFELRIKKSEEFIDGIEIRKFELDSTISFLDVTQPISFEFFSYIAFIDDHRLVFYTPLKTLKEKKKRKRKKHNNKKNEFNLYATKKSQYFKRGYYTFKNADKPGGPGLLEMSIENPRQKSITELTFDVQFKKVKDEDKYEIYSIKLIKMIDKDDTKLKQSSDGNKREYVAENLFSFQPTYYFEKYQSLRMYAKNKNNTIEIDSIALDKQEAERLYFFNNKLQFKEKLGSSKEAKKAIKTW